tara:strand:+ start:2687 stop:3130 length:444 start_codon:yes stop_codon:yes gene_type:complete
MSSASIKRIINCKKKQLIDLVLDIEKYPEFVPWCMDGKIHEKKDSKDLVQIKADLKVGKRFLNQTYSSLVIFHKNLDKIVVNNLEGPLKHLKNEWTFKEINTSTQLDFVIEFELKNPILNKIMETSFDMGLNKIADAFEKRAIDIYR